MWQAITGRYNNCWSKKQGANKCDKRSQADTITVDPRCTLQRTYYTTLLCPLHSHTFIPIHYSPYRRTGNFRGWKFSRIRASVYYANISRILFSQLYTHPMLAVCHVLKTWRANFICRNLFSWFDPDRENRENFLTTKISSPAVFTMASLRVLPRKKK